MIEKIRLYFKYRKLAKEYKSLKTSKKWWESKTIWAGVVALVCGILRITGVDIDPDSESFIVDNIMKSVDGIIIVISALYAIYGRIKAELPIK